MKLTFLLYGLVAFTMISASLAQEKPDTPQSKKGKKKAEDTVDTKVTGATEDVPKVITEPIVSRVVNLTDENFNNHVLPKDGGPWLIMFYANWCPHCKHAMPAFEDLANQLSGSLNVGRVECDHNPDTRSRFSVGGYPTFMLFKDGKMYQYKGHRTVEAWTNFVKEGYKEVEGEEIPMEASITRNFIKEFKRFFEQLKMIAQQKPLVFGGVLGGFLLIIALTCFCGTAIENKIEGNKERDLGEQPNAGESAAVGAPKEKKGESNQPKPQKTKKND